MKFLRVYICEQNVMNVMLDALKQFNFCYLQRFFIVSSFFNIETQTFLLGKF